jgi:hypothetical protein
MWNFLKGYSFATERQSGQESFPAGAVNCDLQK